MFLRERPVLLVRRRASICLFLLLIYGELILEVGLDVHRLEDLLHPLL